MLPIHHLMDDSKCYEEVRRLRWPYSIWCLPCESNKIAKRGKNHRHQEGRRYRCRQCGKQFAELTGTILAGHHQPLRVWIISLSLMGLNWSNRHIARELDRNASDVQARTRGRRRGGVDRRPVVSLEGEVEGDEVSGIAGHKGRPDGIRGRTARRHRLQGARGRGTLVTEKPPLFGMRPRGGEVRITMLETVRPPTIAPLIQTTVTAGSTVPTEEYNLDERLAQGGYAHKPVCHSRGEYARDEDGDGFHEVHVNTMEGFWSLRRAWLRPHRGISQEKFPWYLGFFEFVYNAKRRGKALLGSLMGLFLQPTTAPQNPI